MKPIFALFLVFALLLVANNKLSYGRKDQGEYWKNMMNGQAMPEAIKDMLVKDQQVSSDSNNNFKRDFDIKPNVILYHTHVVSKRQKQRKQSAEPFVKNFKPEFQETQLHD